MNTEPALFVTALKMIKMIEIDGSYGEGGGQIIRTSLSLSAITKKPIKIINIRANRQNPGLQMQHLTCAKAVRNICRGTLENAELHSKELVFNPGEIIGGKYEFNIGTAGSTILVSQTIMPIALFAGKKSEFDIIGGTHNTKAPCYDYFESVFLQAIRKFGVNASSELLETGYYPKGGGRIKITIDPSDLIGNTNWTTNDDLTAIIRVGNLPILIGVREKKVFLQNNIEKVHLKEEHTLSPGNSVFLWKGFVGASVLGAKGKRAEVVAQETIDQFRSEKDEVDRHLADQLLLYAALASGKTEFKTSAITEHFRTNAYIISKFLEREIKVEGTTVKIE